MYSTKMIIKIYREIIKKTKLMCKSIFKVLHVIIIFVHYENFTLTSLIYFKEIASKFLYKNLMVYNNFKRSLIMYKIKIIKYFF